MNLDPGHLNQLLSHVPFPISKTDLVQFTQQQGANDQIIGLLNHLPEKTFNSSQEVQDALGGLGNLGGFKLFDPILQIGIRFGLDIAGYLSTMGRFGAENNGELRSQ